MILTRRLTANRLARPALYGGTALAMGLAVWWVGAQLPPEEERFGADRTGEKNGVRFWSGAHSEVRERGYFRITSPEAWADLWRRHRGDSGQSVPRIDFDERMVVAIFHGESPSTERIELDSVSEDDTRVRVRFAGRYYQLQFDNGNWSNNNRTTAYGIIALPRSSKLLILEEDVRNLKGAPPKWEERARFEEPASD